MLTVTINGISVRLEKAVTILEAARRAGIFIPTLCNHKLLEPLGGCRLCVVEVEKLPRLQTACTQMVTDGMVILTETERIVSARKSVLEFLLINHPMDCPRCDKAGECTLQDLVVRYGPATGRFAEGKRVGAVHHGDPLIVRNTSRCIHCLRCVRMCDDVQGAFALSVSGRGSAATVEPFSGETFDCEYCGNCLTVCPVGALVSRLPMHSFRPWQIDRETETVCPHCGVGCTMTLQTRGDSLVRALPKQTGGPNRGLLCGSGRFGYDYTAHPGRLTTPLVRKNGALEPASWDEALAYTAQRLREVQSQSGSGALAGILSARSTTEDAYAFQKFIRVALGTNNIDSSASLGYAPALRLLEKIFGEGVTANHIHGIANSGGVIVLGGDPTVSAPVLGLQVRAAFRKGLPVVLLGQAPGLRYFTTHRLPALPRSEAAVLAACLTEMKKSPPSGGRHALDDLVARLPEISPAEAAEVSALTEDAIRSAAGAMSAMTAPSLIIGKSLIQSSEGAAALLFAATLAHVTNGKIYLVPDEPNAQGVLDVGCHPDVLPCGRPAAVETYRRQCEDILGSPLPSVPGLGYGAILEAAGRREIRAVYAMGEDILKSLPDPAYARQVLESLDFLVVHDDFLTETAALASVVFPSLSWTEKDGSYTNLERRVQFSRQAVRRQGFPEWETLSSLSSLLGHPLGYTCRADITTEIARVSAVYRNMTPADIESGTWLWPYKGMPLRHDAHQAGIGVPERAELLSRPTGQRPVAFREPVLFHSGWMSCYSPAMTSIAPLPSARLGLTLAERTGIRNGALVTIRSERGSITARAALDASVPDGVVFIPDRNDRGCNALSTAKFAETGALALDGDGVTLCLSEADGGG